MAYRFTPSGIHKSIPTLSVMLGRPSSIFFSASLSLPLSLLHSFSCPSLAELPALPPPISAKTAHGSIWKHLTPVEFKRGMRSTSYACFYLSAGYLGGGDTAMGVVKAGKDGVCVKFIISSSKIWIHLKWSDNKASHCLINGQLWAITVLRKKTSDMKNQLP